MMTILGQEVARLLDGLGVDRALWTEGSMPSVTPLTGEQLGMVQVVDVAATDEALGKASAAFRIACSENALTSANSCCNPLVSVGIVMAELLPEM